MTDQERDAEPQEHARWWRQAFGEWQHWAQALLGSLGLQPEGGLLGDGPAREAIAECIERLTRERSEAQSVARVFQWAKRDALDALALERLRGKEKLMADYQKKRDCGIQNCRRPAADGKTFCGPHELEWESSPERARVRTARADFANRLTAEEANSVQ